MKVNLLEALAGFAIASPSLSSWTRAVRRLLRRRRHLPGGLDHEQPAALRRRAGPAGRAAFIGPVHSVALNTPASMSSAASIPSAGFRAPSVTVWAPEQSPSAALVMMPRLQEAVPAIATARPVATAVDEPGGFVTAGLRTARDRGTARRAVPEDRVGLCGWLLPAPSIWRTKSSTMSPNQPLPRSPWLSIEAVIVPLPDRSR